MNLAGRHTYWWIMEDPKDVDSTRIIENCLDHERKLGKQRTFWTSEILDVIPNRLESNDTHVEKITEEPIETGTVNNAKFYSSRYVSERCLEC